MTHVVKFDCLGTFDPQSLRFLQNYIYVAFKSIASKAKRIRVEFRPT